MSFFNEDQDPFEDILNEFFGRRSSARPSSGRAVKSEAEERTMDYIEEDENVYFVFELLGLIKKDVHVEVKGNELIIKASRKDLNNVEPYLKEKLSQEINLKKTIPVKVKKGFAFELNNGILEVKLSRK